jgi:hypothetical protein
VPTLLRLRRDETCLPHVKERRKQLPLRQVSGRFRKPRTCRVRERVCPSRYARRATNLAVTPLLAFLCFLATSDPGQRATDQNDL